MQFHIETVGQMMIVFDGRRRFVALTTLSNFTASHSGNKSGGIMFAQVPPWKKSLDAAKKIPTMCAKWRRLVQEAAEGYASHEAELIDPMTATSPARRRRRA